MIPWCWDKGWLLIDTSVRFDSNLFHQSWTRPIKGDMTVALAWAHARAWVRLKMRVKFVWIGWSLEEGEGDERVWVARIPGYVAGILIRIRERGMEDCSNRCMRLRAYWGGCLELERGSGRLENGPCERFHHGRMPIVDQLRLKLDPVSCSKSQYQLAPTTKKITRVCQTWWILYL